MTIELTIAILAAAITILAYAVFKSRRQKDIDNPWSVPWHGVLFISILTILLMINHLITLYKDLEGPLV